jgi:hypothetical protein
MVHRALTRTELDDIHRRLAELEASRRTEKDAELDAIVRQLRLSRAYARGLKPLKTSP